MNEPSKGFFSNLAVSVFTAIIIAGLGYLYSNYSARATKLYYLTTSGSTSVPSEDVERSKIRAYDADRFYSHLIMHNFNSEEAGPFVLVIKTYGDPQSITSFRSDNTRIILDSALNRDSISPDGQIRLKVLKFPRWSKFEFSTVANGYFTISGVDSPTNGVTISPIEEVKPADSSFPWFLWFLWGMLVGWLGSSVSSSIGLRRVRNVSGG